MATFTRKIRYLHHAPNADGSLRWYWMPSARLRAQGHAITRLYPNGGEAEAPPAEVIAEAERLNAALDAARLGLPAAPAARMDRPRTQTVAALVTAYKASGEWNGLAAGSRSTYGYAIDYLIAAFGQMPAAALQRKTARAYYQAMHARAPGMADMFCAVGRRIFNHAINQLDMEGLSNPFAKIQAERPAPRQLVWPEAMIDHMVDTADRLGMPSMGTAILLLSWLGQRPSDICAMSVRAWRRDMGRIFIVQKKTKALVAVPPVASLQDRLLTHTPKGLYMVETEAKGRPYTTIHFGGCFRTVRETAEAGDAERGIRPWAAVWADAVKADPEIVFDFLPPAEALRADLDLGQIPPIGDYQARDLRRTAIVRLGRAGCTPQEAASISGHTIEETTKILETYSPRDSQTAAGAIAKLEDYQARRKEKQG